ncbi:MAG: hypothetical protein KBS96_05200 [Lachnospiraceae bacterium]|nr:hypothetical protein [Candidatus Colinaster scatohippi]
MIINCADEYQKAKALFMSEYENRVRRWLRERNSDETVVKRIPFFEDGIVCPSKWFEENCGFRPLFILKEASIGKDNIFELNDYYEEWNGQTRFDHVGDKFGDIKIGVNKFKGNNPWLRIVKLSYGLKDAYEKREFCRYEDIVDISFIKGEKNPNNISGESIYEYATANDKYISMVNQIAVINIKKVGGGTTTDSELSEETIGYFEHIESPLGEFLYKQIVELINPSVIVFCSPDISYLMKKAYGRSLTEKFICLDGYHPTMTSNEKFYEKPVKQYLSILNNQ